MFNKIQKINSWYLFQQIISPYHIPNPITNAFRESVRVTLEKLVSIQNLHFCRWILFKDNLVLTLLVVYVHKIRYLYIYLYGCWLPDCLSFHITKLFTILSQLRKSKSIQPRPTFHHKCQHFCWVVFVPNCKDGVVIILLKYNRRHSWSSIHTFSSSGLVNPFVGVFTCPTNPFRNYSTILLPCGR